MEEIKIFYDDLRSNIEHAFNDIDSTKIILKAEIQFISELKIQAEQTETFVNLDDVPTLRDIVIKSAQDLIVKCVEYQKRYIEKNDVI